MQNLVRGRLVAALLGPGVACAEAPLKVAFVDVSPIGQAGWTFQHDLLRPAARARSGSDAGRPGRRRADNHSGSPAVTHHWGGYYTPVARSVIQGRWSPQSVWGGMKDGLVRLSAIDTTLTDALIATMNWFVRGVVGNVPRP